MTSNDPAVVPKIIRSSAREGLRRRAITSSPIHSPKSIIRIDGLSAALSSISSSFLR